MTTATAKNKLDVDLVNSIYNIVTFTTFSKTLVYF